MSICQDFINNTLTKCLLASQPGGRIIQLKFNNQPNLSSSQLTSTSSSSSSLLDLIATNAPVTNAAQRRSIAHIQTQHQQGATANQPSIPPAPITTTSTPVNQTSIITTVTPGSSALSSTALAASTNKKNIFLEEILNLSSEITSCDATNLTSLPTYFITNITCQQSNQYSYMVTFNGDIFFINLSNLISKKSKIWYRCLNNAIISCYKADIDVSIDYFKHFKRSIFDF